MLKVDITIVGGGMVGLALAAQLKSSGLSIAVVNNRPITRELPDVAESRVSAINVASQAMLERVGAWQQLQSERFCQYTGMQVWEQDSFAKISFATDQTGQACLGTIVENQNIVNALYQVVSQQANIKLLENCHIERIHYTDDEAILTYNNGELLATRLLVGADGAESQVRKSKQMPLTFWAYDQQAIVATVNTEKAHDNIARQAFTPFGPLAFLPLNDPHQCSIVWSQDTERASELMALDEQRFTQQLAVAIDMQLGPCQLANRRVSIPLTMRYAREWLNGSVVLVGDAAHTIHPLAGQGVNLGFQDTIVLAEMLNNTSPDKLAERKVLRAYERSRKADAAKMIATMEGFKQLFAGRDPVKKLIRGIGMRAVNDLPMVKQRLIEQAMGL
ncbi:MAG: FAD-dependent monooxygenase [Alteromonas sp.]